jgi:energy-coupling factor transport system permease protein
VDDVRRLRQARRLRGRADRGVSGLLGIARPALDGAFDRSLQLAASMDARGYGRRASVPHAQRALTAACTLGGLVGVACGTYGLLDAGSAGWTGLPLLLAGLGLALVGMALASRATSRSRYRPDPWRLAEWTTVLAGAVPAAVLIAYAARGATSLAGPGIPLRWPALPLVPVVAILVGLLPAVTTPPQADPDETVPGDEHSSVPAEQVAA